MTGWVDSLSADHLDNWETCKEVGLWGTPSNAGGARPGDDLFLWKPLPDSGWLVHCRVTGAPRRVRFGDPVPWDDGRTYKYLVPIEVVSEPESHPRYRGAEAAAMAGLAHNVQLSQFAKMPDSGVRTISVLLAADEPADPDYSETDPLARELLANLAALRVDRQLGRPAPYQQLVLLWAISRAVRGHERMQAFSTVRGELGDLLARFAVGRTAPDPALPWYALRTSRWWRLIGVPDGPEGPVERGRDLVRRLDAAGGLSQDAHRLVTSDPRFRVQAVRQLERALAGHTAAASTMAALFGEAPPDTSPFEEALRLLLALRGREITTTTGAVNRILGIEPPNVVVATGRSPHGQSVPIADVQNGLDLLQIHGAVTIDVETLGHRSSFVGAVLAARDGASVSGSPPVVSSTNISVAPEPWDPDPHFEGETSTERTVAARREQGRLRATLFGADLTKACALCGEEFPVSFLRAAHIKPRHACSEDERRQLRNIAMPPCVFGCDALFEAGYVAVEDDGLVVLSDDVRSDPTLTRRAAAMEGRRCTAHRDGTAEFFAWHHANRFRT